MTWRVNLIVVVVVTFFCGFLAGYLRGIRVETKDQMLLMRCLDAAELCNDKLLEALRKVDKCGGAINTIDAIEEFYCLKNKQLKKEPASCENPRNRLATQG